MRSFPHTDIDPACASHAVLGVRVLRTYVERGIGVHWIHFSYFFIITHQSNGRFTLNKKQIISLICDNIFQKVNILTRNLIG